MLVLPWFNCASNSAVASHRPRRSVYVHRTYTRAALFIALALVCGAWSTALSQTAYFSGAQTTVGSGFYEPFGVAVDKNGNLYVGDADTYKITEIMATNGVIPSSPTTRTLAAGWPNVEIPTGVTIDSSGNLFIADFYKNVVEEILAVNGSIPSSPTMITLPGAFSSPWGIAVDAEGDVYVSEYYNSDIKEIVAINGSIPAVPTIRTLGSGFLNPEGLAIDSAGNLYVADSQSHSIKEIVAVGGSIPDSPAIVTLASGYCSPDGVSLDQSGDVFFSDYCDSGVYELVAANGTIPPSPTIHKLGTFTAPDDLAIGPKGQIYVGGVFNSIPEIYYSVSDFGSIAIGTSSSPTPLTFAFSAADTLGSASVVTQGATGLDFADAGTGSCTANTAFSAGQTCTVNVTFTPKYPGMRYGAAELQDADGNVIATANLQGKGVGPQVGFGPGAQIALGSGFYQPWGVAVDASGNVFVADTNTYKVKEILAVNGRIPASPTIKTLGVNFGNPSDVAVDGAGNLFVTDFSASAVYEIPAEGGYSTRVSLGGGFANPTGMALDGSGDVFVADYDNDAVKEIPPGCATSACVLTLGSGFVNPHDVALDSAGNVFVADSNSFAVKEILAAGGYTSVRTLLSGIHSPWDLAMDANENLFVSNESDNTILELSAASNYNTVTTVSGSFISPYGLAFDGRGNLYIADVTDSKILMEDIADAPSLSFASTSRGSTSADSPQTVMLENTGNAALALPVPAAGENPSIAANFALDSGGASECPVLGSDASSAGSLEAGASCELAISFSPTTAGSITGALTITDTNLNATAPGYASQSISLSGTGAQATPVLTWPAPAPITYGTALSATQLDATANVPGTFAYAPAGGAIPPVGTDTLTVVFTPSDTINYTTATASVPLLVNPAPGFTLAASPASLSVTQAQKVTTAISVTATGGFNGKVTLALSKLPKGVSAAFSPNPATTTSTLTLSTSKGASTGSFPITITGTSGSLVQTTAMVLTIRHK